MNTDCIQQYPSELSVLAWPGHLWIERRVADQYSTRIAPLDYLYQSFVHRNPSNTSEQGIRAGSSETKVQRDSCLLLKRRLWM
jgi:hypothetical protein